MSRWGVNATTVTYAAVTGGSVVAAALWPLRRLLARGRHYKPEDDSDEEVAAPNNLPAPNFPASSAKLVSPLNPRNPVHQSADGDLVLPPDLLPSLESLHDMLPSGFSTDSIPIITPPVPLGSTLEFTELMAKVGEIKQRGMDAWKAENYALARDEWLQVVALLEGFIPTKDNESDVSSARVNIYLNIAAAMQRLKALQPAIDFCRKALQLEPQSVKAHFKIAGAYAAVNELKPACHHISEAAKLSPHDLVIRQEGERIYMLRGKHFADHGDDESAHKAYTSALSFMQTSASAELKSELERLDLKKDGALIHDLETIMNALQEGQMDLTTAHNRLRRCLAIKNLHKRMEVYKWLVALHRTQGEFEKAYSVLEEQLVVAQQIDKKSELHTLTILSDIAPLSPQGGWVKAMEIQRKVLALAQELGDQERQLSMLNNLITEHGLAEDGIHQLDYTHRKLGLIASMEDSPTRTMLTMDALQQKALGHRLMRDWDACIQAHSNRIALAATLHEDTVTASAVTDLAEVYRQMGQVNASHGLATAALQILNAEVASLGPYSDPASLADQTPGADSKERQRAASVHLAVIEVYRCFANIGIVRKDYSSSMDWLEKVLAVLVAMAQQGAGDATIADTKRLMGEVYLRANRPAQAKEKYEAYRNFFMEHDQVLGLPRACSFVTRACLQTRDPKEAEDNGIVGLQIVKQTHFRRDEIMLLGLVARAYAGQGRAALALETFEKQLTLAQAVQDFRWQIRALWGVARMCMEAKNFYAASGHYSASFTAAEVSHDEPHALHALNFLVVALLKAGEIENAVKYVELALVRCQNLPIYAEDPYIPDRRQLINDTCNTAQFIYVSTKHEQQAVEVAELQRQLNLRELIYGAPELETAASRIEYINSRAFDIITTSPPAEEKKSEEPAPKIVELPSEDPEDDHPTTSAEETPEQRAERLKALAEKHLTKIPVIEADSSITSVHPVAELDFNDLAQTAKGRNATLVYYTVVARHTADKGREFLQQTWLYIYVISAAGELNVRAVEIPAFYDEHADELGMKVDLSDDECYLDRLVNAAHDAFSTASQSSPNFIYMLHSLLIAPVEEFLTSESTIFFPVGSMYLVPFGALRSRHGEPLISKSRVFCGQSVALLNGEKAESTGTPVALAINSAPLIRPQFEPLNSGAQLPFVAETLSAASEVAAEIGATVEDLNRQQLIKSLADRPSLLVLFTHALAHDLGALVVSDAREHVLRSQALSKIEGSAGRVILHSVSNVFVQPGAPSGASVEALIGTFLAKGATSVSLQLWTGVGSSLVKSIAIATSPLRIQEAISSAREDDTSAWGGWSVYL